MDMQVSRIPFTHPSAPSDFRTGYSHPVSVKVVVEDSLDALLSAAARESIAIYLCQWQGRKTIDLDSSNRRWILLKIDGRPQVVECCLSNVDGIFELTLSLTQFEPFLVNGVSEVLRFGSGEEWLVFIHPDLKDALRRDDGVTEFSEFLQGWATGEVEAHLGAGGSQSRCFGSSKTAVCYKKVDDRFLVLTGS